MWPCEREQLRAQRRRCSSGALSQASHRPSRRPLGTRYSPQSQRQRAWYDNAIRAAARASPRDLPTKLCGTPTRSAAPSDQPAQLEHQSEGHDARERSCWTTRGMNDMRQIASVVFTPRMYFCCSACPTLSQPPASSLKVPGAKESARSTSLTRVKH